MNLAGALLAAASDDPGRPALLTGGGTVVTHGRLARAAAALAGTLDVTPGERVVLLGGNEPGLVAAYLGVLAAGAVAVPLNPEAPGPELARELEVVEPALVLATRAHLAAAHAVAPDARAIDVDPERDGDDGASIEPVPRDASDVAALLFTAGTAGAPRAAMLTHGSLLANLEQLQQHPGLSLHPDDVVLGVLPCFHVFGLQVMLGLALYAGAAVALVEHFHPARTIARVRDDRVTVIGAVPAVYDAWLALPDTDAPADAFATVRLAVSGAAPLPSETVVAMRDRFGVVVHDGYGLTEASPVVTASAMDAEPRPGSVGRPVPGVEVRLVDVDGHDALAGDPGEIWVRGPNVFAGYWRDPDATARVLTPDGWLRTGDLAVAADDGSLRLVDRGKDLVIVSGFNVYPGEVETVLCEHPDVDDAAVTGAPHPRTGETVVAYVVPAEGASPDPESLAAFVAQRLARYKVPTRVTVVASLPRGLGGKLLRRELASLDTTANPA